MMFAPQPPSEEEVAAARAQHVLDERAPSFGRRTPDGGVILSAIEARAMAYACGVVSALVMSAGALDEETNALMICARQAVDGDLDKVALLLPGVTRMRAERVQATHEGTAYRRLSSMMQTVEAFAELVRLGTLIREPNPDDAPTPEPPPPPPASHNPST